MFIASRGRAGVNRHRRALLRGLIEQSACESARAVASFECVGENAQAHRPALARPGVAGYTAQHVPFAVLMKEGEVVGGHHELMRGDGGDGVEDGRQFAILHRMGNGRANSFRHVAIHRGNQVEHRRMLGQRRRAGLQRAAENRRLAQPGAE